MKMKLKAKRRKHRSLLKIMLVSYRFETEVFRDHLTLYNRFTCAKYGKAEERQGHMRCDITRKEGKLLLGVVLGAQIGARRQLTRLCRSTQEVHNVVSYSQPINLPPGRGLIGDEFIVLKVLCVCDTQTTHKIPVVF